MMKPLYLLIIVVLLFPGRASVLAQDLSESERFQKRLEELRQLKQSDPSAYEEVMSKKRAKLQRKIRALKDEDPEQFEFLMKERLQKRRDKFQRMKNENPEAFERMKSKAKARMLLLKEKNPEKFQRLMKMRSERRQASSEDKKAFQRNFGDIESNISDRDILGLEKMREFRKKKQSDSFPPRYERRGDEA